MGPQLVPNPIDPALAAAIEKVAEDKFDEKIKALKTLAYVFTTVASFFVVSLFLPLLGVTAIRDVFVSTFLVDVDERIEAYAEDKDRKRRVRERLEQRIDDYMGGVVAYSFNADFRLATSQRQTYKMSYYKAAGDSGRLTCEAIYPTDPKHPAGVRNAISVYFNDMEEPMKWKWEVPDDPNSRKKVLNWKVVSANNEDLFSRDRSRTPHQYVRFQLQDAPKFEGFIDVNCTLLIIGRAKMVEAS